MPGEKDLTMTTLWEMAATIRAEEAQAKDSIREQSRIASRELERPIDLRELGHMEYWCKSLGATRMQLYRAVAHVGPTPSAVRSFLRARFVPGKLSA